jgi:NADPH-dependent 2,4-dienoyl-CoA reductase/sulfur reductase-like enzyme/peroxiredoxin family protein/rhodanese-related sulfurtransferase/TusA-related sulfurtransferase
MTDKMKVLIVGGVAGGASAAARLRRLSETAEIVMFERGEYISFANCGLPYHIGGAIAERNRLLVQTPEAMRKRFKIDVRTKSEVVRIDREKRTVTVRDLSVGKEYIESYDTLILSPGAEPFRPPIAGIHAAGVFTLRNIPDMDAIIQRLAETKANHALVIGGGYIGLEMTEALIERGVGVTLVELEPQVMGTVDAEMAAPLADELRLHGVDLKLNNSVTSIEESGERLTVQLSGGDSVQTDMVIVSVGVRPETKLAKEAGLTLGARGGIAVNPHMQTNDAAIYAVGDAVEVTDFVSGAAALIPLAGPANRQGRIAADHICGRDSAYRHTQGTAICKVFNLGVATTGLNEKLLKRNKIAYEKVYVHPASHAGYYPGAMQMSLKLLFSPETGKILGAQAVGADGVDKRIDVIAVALRAGLTVQDLQHLELCYAPPYGSAKDPVNYAGFVAASVMNGDMPICHAAEAANPAANQLLLDTRTSAEVQNGTIPGAVVIPLDELRGRLNELPKDKEILAFCQVGLRGYLACRILMQHGYKCRNLTGGYKTYCAVTGTGKKAEPVRQEMKDDAGESSPAAEVKPAAKTITVDACGLACPGPLMKLREAVDGLAAGDAVTLRSTDPGFAQDVKAFCHSTGHTLQAVKADKGVYAATVVKAQTTTATEVVRAGSSKKKTIVVFSGDFDKAMAAFIIANGAAAMGSEVTLFFTFWGLNLLRRSEAVAVTKTPIEKMFGWMMPRGAERTKLSKMNMLGMGTQMIKGIMKNKNVPALSELIEKARQNKVHLVACAMSMDLMGIQRAELIDGVEEGGVAMYLDQAEAAGVNLFI